MCSCKLGRGTRSSLQKSGITNFVSEKGLRSGETESLFQLLYCIGPNEVNEKLSAYKLPNGQPLQLSNNEDVKYLAQVYDSGKWKELGWGDIKNALLGIQFTQEQMNNAACNTGLLID